VEPVHLEPLAMYSKNHDTPEQIPNGSVITLPNDPANQFRALKLLENAGLLTLKPEAAVGTRLAEAVAVQERLRPLVRTDRPLPPVRTAAGLDVAYFPGSDRLEAAAERLRATGSTVTTLPFDARSPETHGEVVDKAFADGDIDVTLVAFGVQGDNEQGWTDVEAAREQGVDAKRGIAIDAMNIDGSVRSARARLWPQTEWLKASLILSSLCTEKQR
ncbi:MetQ/NlpA family ABC transporter substrate-binding protein, partial [Chryseobacterium ginsengisoli]|uniref:MetQ/NlpA family ABC transporter substrate-binding protein n=1 Tax=Chryseobacterium ginsengisoli TaxID=363853 RepID=UPI0031EF9039